MSSNKKRSYESGCQKKKKKLKLETELKKTKPVSNFFKPIQSGKSNNSDTIDVLEDNNDDTSDHSKEPTYSERDLPVNNPCDSITSNDIETVCMLEENNVESPDKEKLQEKDSEKNIPEELAPIEEILSVECPSHSDNESVHMQEDYDIGIYLQKCPSDFEKYYMIKNKWKPPANFSWPYSIQNQGSTTKRRYLNQDHIDKHPYLAYSVSQGGLLCKYCVLSSNTSGLSLGKLSKCPLTRYDRLTGITGDLESHSLNQYHLDAKCLCLSFLSSYEANTNIIKQQDSVHALTCKKKQRNFEVNN